MKFNKLIKDLNLLNVKQIKKNVFYVKKKSLKNVLEKINNYTEYDDFSQNNYQIFKFKQIKNGEK